MLLHRLADTSAQVAATSARLGKTQLLADLVADLTPQEAPIAVAYLAGDLPQGRIGIGYAALSNLDVPPQDQPTLTISDVDAAFTAIQQATGKGSQQRKQQHLTQLLAKATEQEQHFLTQLLAGNLRQGALEGVMVDAVAQATGQPPPKIRRAAMLAGDLAAVAAAALDPDHDGLHAFSLQVFTPLKPMLAQTADDVATANHKLGDGRQKLWEWKLDGARVQVHRHHDEVKVYSRSLKDFTASLPAVVEAAKALPVTSVILDGEALAFTPTGRPLPFQDTMTRLGHQGLTTAFFDILHLDGTDVLDLPAAERLPYLDAAVPPELRIPRLITADPDEAQGFFDEATAAGHEGVMAKALDAPYEAGRRGAAWLKVKPVLTLDLVVLAVEWGSGRRQGWLSNIHLGARDPTSDTFVMLGKTFKGMTDEMLQWQTERFLDLETHRTGHVVHVRPEQVVEIALDGVQASPRYPGGMALRFARVKQYRHDKTAAEADTIGAVRQIFEAGRR